MQVKDASYHLGLRAGDAVVVRAKEEILATLDPRGRLDGMPFQPEMFAFCGKTLQVAKVAHKTCDTINKTGGRRVHDAVHLEGVHCNGSGHDGCQADCNLFWKEAWLRRAEGAPTARRTQGAGCTEADVQRAAHAAGEESSTDPTWVCQTTALFEASEPLNWWDARQYVRDLTTRNHRLSHMLRLGAFAAFRMVLSRGVGYRLLIKMYNVFQKVRGGKPYPIAGGTIAVGQQTPLEVSNLQPGEWVVVRPIEEIRPTLNTAGFNRGMWFDQEMVQYCGGRYRVQMRVDRLIHEKTGKMLQMKNPCIQLEAVHCRATCTMKRMGCPRAVNTYWRENWLRRETDA